MIIMWGSIGVALVNIILNALLIPEFGTVAAAYTTLISYMGYAVVHFFLQKYCTDRFNIMEMYDLKFLIGISLALVFFTLLSVKLYRTILMRYLLLLISIMLVIWVCFRKRSMWNTLLK